MQKGQSDPLPLHTALIQAEGELFSKAQQAFLDSNKMCSI
jgi:hypothetical protein